MAKTIARATGYDATRTKTVQRLGSKSAMAQAATWKTFATVLVSADGSGYVRVQQNGQCIHVFNWDKE